MSKYNYKQNKSDYETPPELYKMALNRLGRSKFSLDVCCNRQNIPAFNYYKDGETDGLKEEWLSFNWCNPPFKECAKWIKKAYEEQKKSRQTAMLLPVRTETKYWHDYILFNPKVEIKWLRKGYSFIDAATSEKCGIFKNALALVYFL